MKDVTSAIRTAVIAKLRNNVMVDGEIVRVVARVAPSTNNGKYIYFPTQDSDNASAKQFFSTDHTMTIECVYRNDDGNNSGLELMVNQVLQLLGVHNQVDMPQPIGFHLVDFVFVRKNELIDIDGVGYVFRSILTFEAIIDEQQ